MTIALYFGRSPNRSYTQEHYHFPPKKGPTPWRAVNLETGKLIDSYTPRSGEIVKCPRHAACNCYLGPDRATRLKFETGGALPLEER